MTVITWWMPVGVSEPLNKGRRSAVLKAIIREAVQHGCCTMSTLDLADVAMCNSSTVRSVIEFAIEAGLIIVKDGTIMLDPAWLKYLRGYAAANREDWSLSARATQGPGSAPEWRRLCAAVALAFPLRTPAPGPSRPVETSPRSCAASYSSVCGQSL